jgi:hypothetical protein
MWILFCDVCHLLKQSRRYHHKLFKNSRPFNITRSHCQIQRPELVSLQWFVHRHKEKRDRSPSPSHKHRSIMKFRHQQADNSEEYKRAVTFLQEFHSRRVAALHSTTRLDAITEDGDLADDFSLALNLNNRRGPLINMCRNAVQRCAELPRWRRLSRLRRHLQVEVRLMCHVD